MSISKHLKILDRSDYEEKQLKQGSISLEMKMIIDKGDKIGSFIKMAVLDDFRNKSYDEVYSYFMDNSKHIASTFALAVLHRKDCLNGNRTPQEKEEK